MPKLYTELANWWPLLSAYEDYADEAAFFAQALSQAGLPSSPLLLELGSGGGNNAFHLKKIFSHVTLTDLSQQMLGVSRLLNPDCEHVEGDMRTLRLGRVFDVVFIHDAMVYMTTAEDLKSAVETAYVHCRFGGMALFVPDYVREIFQPATDHGGHDGGGRGLRYLEWTYDPDENDHTYITEYAYLLREDGQPAQVEHDQHICGLFSRDEWLTLLREVGFEPDIIRDAYARDLFLARKPGY
jgi:SAM-dependent methyltransferase